MMAKKMAPSKEVDSFPESILRKNKLFAKFELLEEAVRRFEQLTFHKYFKSEARTLESALRKGIKRVEENSKFKYYSCVWLCVRGGKSFSRSRGERKSRTLRIGCPSFIRTRISDCGKFFKVIDVRFDHNHSSSPEMFQQLECKKVPVLQEDPTKKSKYVKKRSRLKTAAQAKLRNLLSKSVIEERALTPRDSVSKLSAIYGPELTVAVDDDNEVMAITYCDQKMRNMFQEFPEILMLESSNYVESLDLSHVNIFYIVDALGELRPVMIAMIIRGGDALCEWVLNEFHRQQQASRTQILLLGRPFVDIDIKNTLFKDVHVLWEPAQTLAHFRHELGSRLGHLSEAGKRSAHYSFQKLIFCPANELKGRLKDDSLIDECVVNFYEDEWEKKSRFWNMSELPYDEQQMDLIFKKILRIKRHVKSVLCNFAVNHYMIFVKLLELYDVLDDLYQGDVLDSLMKVHQSRYQPKTSVDEAEFKYKGIVTEFAYSFLKTQFNVFERGVKIKDAKTMMTVIQHEKVLTRIMTTKHTCTCRAFKALKLPCAHILSFRIGSQMNLFDEDLVHDRWKRSSIKINSDAEKLIRVPIFDNGETIIEADDEEDVRVEESMEIEIVDGLSHPVPDDAAELPLGMVDNDGSIIEHDDILDEEPQSDDQTSNISGRSGRFDTIAPSNDYSERRAQCEKLCSNLCSVGAAVTGKLYMKRMSVLQQILDAWQNGSDVCVVESTPNECPRDFSALRAASAGNGPDLSPLPGGSSAAAAANSYVVNSKGVYMLSEDSSNLHVVENFDGRMYPSGMEESIGETIIKQDQMSLYNSKIM